MPRFGPVFHPIDPARPDAKHLSLAAGLGGYPFDGSCRNALHGSQIRPLIRKRAEPFVNGKRCCREPAPLAETVAR